MSPFSRNSFPSPTPGGSKPAGPGAGLVMRLGGRRPALCLLVGLGDAAAQVPGTGSVYPSLGPAGPKWPLVSSGRGLSGARGWPCALSHGVSQVPSGHGAVLARGARLLSAAPRAVTPCGRAAQTCHGEHGQQRLAPIRATMYLCHLGPRRRDLSSVTVTVTGEGMRQDSRGEGGGEVGSCDFPGNVN